MKDFKDKVVLISGSSRGVGLALSKEFVKRGAKVVINARGEKRLNQAKSELLDMGGEVASVSGDVGVWEDAQKIVQTAIDRFKLPFPLKDRYFILKVERFPETFKSQWIEILGNTSVNIGSWRLESFENNPKTTLAVYTLYIDPALHRSRLVSASSTHSEGDEETSRSY
jgi:NAD(P)-dependent dehydrogenase (short-subunit alcohol dehydrogenase family)